MLTESIDAAVLTHDLQVGAIFHCQVRRRQLDVSTVEASDYPRIAHDKMGVNVFMVDKIFPEPMSRK